MRRTTIYRSEVTLAAALLALVATTGAAQRAPSVIQRPIDQARRAAAQTSATQNPTVPEDQPAAGRRTVEITSPTGEPIAATPQNPGTHIVQQGETLWALAQQYLGDPMLWPELYRLNTDVVEDPHWIYPGEELRLSAASPPPATADTTTTQQSITVQSQNLNVTPTTEQRPQGSGAAPLGGPTIFSERPARARAGGASISVMSNNAYRAVREGEYFSSGFLTEGQPLNSGRVVRTTADVRDASVSTRTTARLFETIVISAPAGEGVQAGDLLLAFRRSDEVGTWGQVITPTGLLRVRGPIGEGNNLLGATVIALYQPLDVDQELLKVQPFVNTSNARAVPVTDGVTGHVIRMREERNVSQIQDVVFFDKGANDGLRLGDIIQLYVERPDEAHGGTVEEDQGRAIVVSTRSRTATAVIVELYRGDVGQQSLVRQVRRMPS